ncbi:MAG: sensor histidine kinase [Chloroflexi bacterium]|nr:sensor histidine kinase [Chloroflexota bacterium]
MEHADTVLVFFMYGLASFAMGLVVLVALRGAPGSPLADSLRSLAAFGLLHGAAQWILMSQLIKTGGVSVEGSVAMRGLYLLLSALSALALLRFGAQLAGSARLRWIRWAPWGLAAAWVLSVVLPQLVAPAVAAEVRSLPQRETCLECHWDASAAYVTASRGWLNGVDITSRYLLVLPGSLLAAIGMVRQGRKFAALGLPGLARETGGAAAAFVVSALVAGLVVPPGPYPPASVLNYATVTDRIGFAPQILWVVGAAALAVFVVRMLGILTIERDRQLQAAVTTERERIGREMHDGLAQALAYVGLRSSLAHELLERRDLHGAEDAIGSIGSAVQDAYRDVRASILELRSADVGPGGLWQCVTEYCEKFSLETGIDVRLELQGGEHGHWSPLVELQLIRIVQEALANVRRHSGARHARVRLERRGDACVLSISDDGRGFSFDGQTRRPGARFGLQTMRERAEGLGGELRIESTPGRGTVVTATVPHAFEAG